MMETLYVRSSNEEQKGLVSRVRSGDLIVSNKETLEAFKIAPNYDPHSKPLDNMDPVHYALFANPAGNPKSPYRD